MLPLALKPMACGMLTLLLLSFLLSLTFILSFYFVGGLQKGGILDFTQLKLSVTEALAPWGPIMSH